MPMTASFAKRPLKIATVAGQLSFSTPMGSNTGVNAVPTAARTDLSLSSFPIEPSVPIVLSTPRTSTMGTMTCPARKMKTFRRSQECRRMCLRRGKWYGGSSMMKCEGAPRKSVFLSSSPVRTPRTMPAR